MNEPIKAVLGFFLMLHPSVRLSPPRPNFFLFRLLEMPVTAGDDAGLKRRIKRRTSSGRHFRTAIVACIAPVDLGHEQTPVDAILIPYRDIQQRVEQRIGKQGAASVKFHQFGMLGVVVSAPRASTRGSGRWSISTCKPIFLAAACTM